MIISASRRTDIPAFYSQWFINRLKEGYVLIPNPRNPGRLGRVELSASNVDCIVFWTKNPIPMLDKLEQLEAMGYSFYIHFTLTPYDAYLATGIISNETGAQCKRRRVTCKGRESGSFHVLALRKMDKKS